MSQGLLVTSLGRTISVDLRSQSCRPSGVLSHRDRPKAQSPMSVRAANEPLSPEDPRDEDHALSTDPSMKRSSTKSKKDKGKDRASDRVLQSLLLCEEREIRHLRATLQAEMTRAEAAEKRTWEVLLKANVSEVSAAKANEELRLYKDQYANLQKELERAHIRNLTQSLEPT